MKTRRVHKGRKTRRHTNKRPGGRRHTNKRPGGRHTNKRHSGRHTNKCKSTKGGARTPYVPYHDHVKELNKLNNPNIQKKKD